MSFEGNQLYEFGSFRADRLRRLLLRGGQPVPLTSRAFDTLLVLIQNRDRVLAKEELLKAIWPDSFVEEANLAQHVSTLRKALGESPGEHRYIATVPGFGYRFVAEVRALPAAEAEFTLERRTTAEVVVEEETPDRTLGTLLRHKPALVAVAVLLAVAVAAASWGFWYADTSPVSTTRSIAVLPFQALGAPAENALGLGLADAVITKLSNVRQLIVRPTSAILKYATLPDPQTAGRELDVDALLEGKLQQTGDRIRVTVQLVRAADRRPLWAETFDAASTDIFTIEDAISQKVSHALAVTLTRGEKQRVDRHDTTNLEAYRNYLSGRYAEFRFSPEGLNRAIAYFDRAVAIDPGYALAYAGLADAYTTASDWVLSPREAMPKAEAAARRSLELDPDSAEAYGALAHAQMHQWKFADAEKAFTRALALNPNITSSYFAYGEYLAALGKEDQAVAELRKGLKIEPLSAEILLMLPFPLYLERNYAAAEAAGAVAIQAHPDFWALYMGRGYAYLAEGRFREAIADFEKGRALNPEATVNLAGLAASYARSGNRSEGTKVLAALQAMKSRRYVSPFDLAVVYESFGDSAQALDCLDQAYHDNSEMMLFLDLYPPLAGLRANPRFRELVRRVGVAPK